jgi:hypothetical protein
VPAATRPTSRPSKNTPNIAAAEQLWNQPAARSRLKVLILGDCSRASIAQRFGVDVAVIAALEDLFFDVRRMRNAIDWVHCCVIQPEIQGGNFDLATKLNVAFCRGPQVAETILDDSGQVPVDGEAHVFDRQRIASKLQKMVDAPVNSPCESLDRVKLYLEYEYKNECLDLQRRRLQQRCEEASRRQGLAERRLEEAIERERERKFAREQRAGLAELKRRNQQRLAEEEAVRVLAAQRAAETQADASPLAKLKWHTRTRPACEQ